MSLFQCLHYVSRSGLSFADSFNDEEHGKGSFEEQRFLASILALQVLNGIFKNCVSFPFTSCLLCSLNFRCMVWAKLLSEDWFLNMTFHKMFFRDKALSGSKISDWLPFIKEKTWGTRKKVIFDRNHDYSEETNFQKLRQEGQCSVMQLDSDQRHLLSLWWLVQLPFLRRARQGFWVTLLRWFCEVTFRDYSGRSHPTLEPDYLSCESQLIS